jgi:hypothetical protein
VNTRRIATDKIASEQYPHHVQPVNRPSSGLLAQRCQWTILQAALWALPGIRRTGQCSFLIQCRQVLEKGHFTDALRIDGFLGGMGYDAHK